MSAYEIENHQLRDSRQFDTDVTHNETLTLPKHRIGFFLLFWLIDLTCFNIEGAAKF